MKKNYVMPLVKVVNLNIKEHILGTGSNGAKVTGVNSNADLKLGTSGSNGDARSRESIIDWDLDE